MEGAWGMKLQEQTLWAEKMNGLQDTKGEAASERSRDTSSMETRGKAEKRALNKLLFSMKILASVYLIAFKYVVRTVAVFYEHVSIWGQR